MNRAILTISILLGSTLLGLAAAAEPAAAQTGLTGVILRGAAPRPGLAPTGGATPLVPGVRIESPPRSWTEIAFSDGSSIVLEPGADLTFQGITQDPASGHLVIQASAGRGRLRISTSDGVEVVVATTGGQVRVIAASAVLVAGRGGSVTMLSGSRVAVVRNGTEEVLRRPGFAVNFDAGVERESRVQLAQALESFAPVTAVAPQTVAAPVDYTSDDTEDASPSRRRASASARSAAGSGLTSNEGVSFQVSNNTGAGNAGNVGGNTGGGNTGGGGTAVTVPPSFGASFNLASAVIGTGSATASGIAAPGSSNATSAAAAQQIVTPGTSQTDTDTGTQAVLGFNTTALGSARVRRIPVSSRDTARISNVGVVDNAYQNLIAKPLPEIQTNNGVPVSQNVPAGSPTVYDATTSVGYLALQLSDFSFQPNVWIGDGATPGPSCTLTQTNTEQACALKFPAVARVPISSSDNIVLPGSTSPTNQIPMRLEGPRDAANNLDVDHSGLVLYVGPDIALNGNAASVAPFVYIIDKVTAGVPARGLQPNDRLFSIGGQSVGDGLAAGLPQNGGTMPAGSVSRYAVSDLLNPTAAGGLSTTRPLPDQFNTPTNGVLPAAFSSFNAFRPEETFTASPGARGDTQLWVVAGSSAARPNVASRADLQITADGRSNASVSVGGIAPLSPAVPSLVLAGQTVGSTQPSTAQFSAAINSNFGSLATGPDGQSTHLLGAPTLNNGQISYFAVTQADPRVQSVNTNSAATATTAPAQVQTGQVLPVGSDPASAATPFAYTRLATNVGAGGVSQPAGAAALQGFATAVVEHSDPNQSTVQAYTTTSLGDAAVNRSANANTFSASFALAPTSVGSLPSDPAAAPSPVASAAPMTLAFGDAGAPGATPKSAFVSNSTFAALGFAGGRTAMVSVDSDLLKGIAGQPAATGQPITIAHPTTGALLDGSLPASNDHLAWGYFLGDLATRANGAIQDHANLGFWVAGRPVGADVIQTLTGTANYSGGLIGTVVEPGRIATVAGQFAQQWNFGTRTGSINAAFDGRSFNSVAASMPTGNVFTGSGVSGDRTLAVQGSFFNNGAIPAGGAPAAVGGAFAIHNATGSYGANGVLVGARRP